MIATKVAVFVFMVCVCVAHSAFAVMPPDETARINLEAELIVIGKVTETGRMLASDNSLGTNPTKGLFVVEVLHIVKGYGQVKEGETLSVIFRLPQKSNIEGIGEIKQGASSVDVDAGTLVVLYLDHSQQAGVYKPKLAGASVAVIERSW